MERQYLLTNNDFPETITVKIKNCSEIRIRTEDTQDILQN